ncbi:sigma-70 family RNA polymerase sigma factor [Sphingomonas daechungensis]|uniref:RNA polymerase sigma factor n=3 Tax=Sphingomonas daechungensis TaxID=1176646 RepID=A0ABX6T3K6_9SPHN|nr:sigma-70 family RNA polymerase sigma factor [Sphingomonas daechungensis]
MNRGVNDGPARDELRALMLATADGDVQAFETLYGRTSGKLYGICLRLLGNEAEAQDVLQDTYVKVWQKSATFDGDKASPITWLAVVARNKAIDRLRQRLPNSEDVGAAEGIADGGLSAIDVIEDRQESERLAGCLDELEQRTRDMIRAAFLDGATYPELAERQGVPLGTMKSWIRRGLQRLRGCLER